LVTESQDKIKIKNKTMKIKNHSELTNSDYKIASNALNINIDLLLDEEDFKFIFSLEEKLLISDFLENYNNFTEDNLLYVQKFIIKNLEDTNKLFVSDLIEFATEFDLNLPYQKCLNFLDNNSDDNSYVLLSTIFYISKKINFQYINQIHQKLNNILNNPQHNQSAQVTAAFVLFRITHNKQYYNDLIDLVVNGHKDNKILLQNILNLEYNQPTFFSFNEELNLICK